MYQIGWFSTGRDAAARDLLRIVQNSINRGEIEAQIPFVFSNREPGEAKENDLFLNLTRSYSVPLICLSYTRFRSQKEGRARKGEEPFPLWRLEYDREVMKLLEGFHPDICVLAGYMLIVGEEMCRKYNMINLHPAIPGGPTGTWQEVTWKLIEVKASESGAMMHLVTPELDKGPPATYCTFPIRGEPFDKYWKEIEEHSLNEIKRQQGDNNRLFQLIRQHGLAREFPLILSTLKAFSQGRIKIEAGKVINASGKPIKGYNLTEEIDKIIQRGTKL